MRSVIGLCALVGSFVGSYVPTLWGASSLGVESLLFGAAGAVAGVIAGARIANS
jgi:ABC-type cobalt transport system substrate-binding protein